MNLMIRKKPGYSRPMIVNVETHNFVTKNNDRYVLGVIKIYTVPILYLSY